MYRSPVRQPLITGNKDLHDITVDIARPIETSANNWWWSLFIVSAMAMLWGFGCIVLSGIDIRFFLCQKKKRGT